jgi:solute carrier family 6 (neurotransmitter transporter)
MLLQTHSIACVAATFIVQFLLLMLVSGIPLFTLHTCLGQCLAAGVMDMWRISPIFQVSSVGAKLGLSFWCCAWM